MTEIQATELFHLFFLKHLGDQLDKENYALKGGCNLRFYHQSIRYSEDIDFDVKVIARDTLKSNVRKILSSTSLKMILASRGIEIVDKSEPKQTDTTQRWKIGLKIASIELPIHTKIEFSRRKFDPGAVFEAINPQIVQNYGIYSIYSTHYNKDAAYQQKIKALIHRTEIQARDVFDLDLLLKAGATPSLPMGVSKDDLNKAQENALSISYQDFKSQVLSYLLPEFQAAHNGDTWNGLIEKIVDQLERLKT